MEDRSKRAETVRPLHDQHCERQLVCDIASSAKNVMNDIELNDETDDEDMEDGETGLGDGSAAAEFAAYLMNRCDTGSDGKTPIHKLHGRTPILEFGDNILHMPAIPARGRKWNPRFYPSVFVGMLNS